MRTFKRIRVPYFVASPENVLPVEMAQYAKENTARKGDVIQAYQITTAIDPDGWPVRVYELVYTPTGLEE